MKTKIILISISIMVVAALFAGCGNNQPEVSGTTEVSSTTSSLNATEASTAEHSENITEEASVTSILYSEVVPTETAVSVSDTIDETIEPSEVDEVFSESTEPSTGIIHREPQINFSDLE